MRGKSDWAELEAEASRIRSALARLTALSFATAQPVGVRLTCLLPALAYLGFWIEAFRVPWRFHQYEEGWSPWDDSEGIQQSFGNGRCGS
ncbi:hypothetical protein BH18ACT6_BH18ACT6_11950 [soil metagenome]